jgi:hypothetical protein
MSSPFNKIRKQYIEKLFRKAFPGVLKRIIKDKTLNNTDMYDLIFKAKINLF